jgi:putative MATE family efflux protein
MTARNVRESASARSIFGLALPALGVLAAEPAYLLFDTAVVGRLGGLPLAGLAAGGLVLATVSTQLTFLSYGTTSRAARKHGAGDERGAVEEGMQATWLALALGTLITLVVQVFARPLLSVLTGRADIAAEAETWLRIASFGVPLILVTMAGNGWLRGVQRVTAPLRITIAGFGLSAVLCPVLVHGLLGAPRLGLPGSAIANIAGQALAALLFLRVLRAEHVPLRPHWSVMRAQIVLGRDLIARSLGFQACFLSAAAVASRFGAASLGAHQIVLQLWNFVGLALDSLAVAAQSLVGAALGAGAVAQARGLAWRVAAWSTAFAAAVAAAFTLGRTAIPRLFTSDAAVLGQTGTVWWIFVALIPLAGVVFALDGVLLGAGDAAYLRNATLASALLGFLPLIWLSLARGWGLAGIWCGLGLFIVLRLIAVVARVLSPKWSVPGSERAS